MFAPLGATTPHRPPSYSFLRNNSYTRYRVSPRDPRRALVIIPHATSDDDIDGDEAMLRSALESMDSDEIIKNPQMAEKMRLLKKKLSEAQRALKEQEEQQQALAPFRVSAPRRGIVGNSRYAASLRSEILKASRDPRRMPVIIFGEPGLEKNNIAALIHFGSRNGKYPLVSIDCDRLDDDCSELIGRGAKKGLMAWLPPEGTIILNNVHKAPPAVRPLLEREVATASILASMDDLSFSFDDDEISYGDDDGSGAPSLQQPQQRLPLIIMTAETRVPEFETNAKVIKVPPLRVRPEDIGALAKYYLRTLARQRGLGPLSLTPGALRRLEAGQYPNNVKELQASVERAVAQEALAASRSTEGAAARTAPRIIGEEVFWFASQAKDRLRLDLLGSMPLLRQFLRSKIWPDGINFNFTVYAFAALVAILFIGPQDRDHNFALNAFWCYWWPLSFVAYPFLGRVWCSVCPFMIYGELVQKVRIASGATLLKWPKETMEKWGPWFLFWLFAGILIWEEVWDLPQNAALSSWLLLLITAGAMIGSYFFERRIWCRYLCPIGGMNGMFAKLSMTELRARQGVCSAECDTYSCYKGGPATPPEGMESVGCPVYSHPAQLQDNRNCVLCMECLKACPHRSIEFRFRIPGADLWDGHKPLEAEVALQFMLLGSVYLHDLPLILGDFGIDPGTVMTDKIPHIAVSALILAAPGAFAWGVDAGWRFLALTLARQQQSEVVPALATSSMNDAEARAISLLSSAAQSYSGQQSGAAIVPPAKPFVDLSYGYLPLVWAGTLAYYEELFFREAGLILPTVAATVGLHAPSWVPAFQADPAVVEFLQGTTITLGMFLSLGMTRRIGAQPWKYLVPQCVVTFLFASMLWHLIMPR